MKNQVLIKRYAQGFLYSLKGEDEYHSHFQELKDFVQLLDSQKNLQNVLLTPFIPTSKKKKIIDEMSQKFSFQKKTGRFLSILVDNERLELLPEILAFLPDLWNEERGITTIEVFSVVPLTEAQKKKLKENLEVIEKGTVALKYKTDSSLIGGISLRKGNIVYDVSIEGNLAKLQEKIIEG